MTITPTNFAVHEFSEKEKAELVSALRDHMDGLPVQCSANVYKVFAAITGKDKEQAKMHQHVIDVWCNWRKQNTGLMPLITGKQGKAAKAIATYLLSVSRETGKPAENMLPFVFDNWHRLSGFLQEQTDLSQILSNLNNILTQIRNGQPTRNNKQPKDSDLEAAAQRRFGNGKP